MFSNPHFQVPDLASLVWESWPQGQGLTTVSKIPGSPCLVRLGIPSWFWLFTDLRGWHWVELLLHACPPDSTAEDTEEEDKVKVAV